MNDLADWAKTGCTSTGRFPEPNCEEEASPDRRQEFTGTNVERLGSETEKRYATQVGMVDG